MKRDRDQRQNNESALACRAVSGDREALEALLRRNWSWIRVLTAGYLKSFNDIDDVLQEVCLRVMQKIHTLREPERFRPWLAVIVRRQALGFLRQKHPAMSLENLTSEFGTSDPALVQRQEYDDVIAAIMELPEKYRQVILLKYYHNYDYAEIAEILDCSVCAVQTRLFRARKMIAMLLEHRKIEKIPRG